MSVISFRSRKLGSKTVHYPVSSRKRSYSPTRGIRSVGFYTKVVVEERGRIVTKPIGKCLPPYDWVEAKKKEIQSNAKDKGAVIGNIWWSLPAGRKLAIMNRYGKFKRFA